MADRHTTEKLLEGERLSGKVTLFAKVTILPGDELPYHEHHGETEAYHILSGAGMYQDNNKTYPVQAGMTTFCEDGSGHAVSCSRKRTAGISGNDPKESGIAVKISCRTLMRQLLHLCSSVNSPHPYSNCYQEYTCYAAH